MATLKDLFLEIDEEESGGGFDDGGVEVYADSVNQALQLAAEELNIDIMELGYEILEKGTKGFFGIGRQPYRVLVFQMDVHSEHDDLEELEQKLGGDHVPSLDIEAEKNKDGDYTIRVTKKGVMLTVNPPKGNGSPVDVNDVYNKISSMRIAEADNGAVQKAVNKASGEPVKIGPWTPNPDFDSSMTIEITEDEMKAFVHFVPPRYSGRHLEMNEITDALKGRGVITGIKEDEIQRYLEEMDYSRPLLAAEGSRARNGRDAYIDYKVRVETSDLSFEEDESGKVDFRNLELLENVVAGQLLALKVPAEEGVPGRTITNKILPAKSGKDTQMKYGKGTILSEDGTELTAEINGQVVYKGSKITVEPVYVVNGDVSLETGNIVFLGSVIVSGNVQDNFIVKAAGNIEVKGTVQKANLEAEGDIFIHQGISGREEAHIESTGGSIYAKFIQNANVVAEKDIMVPEGILHSNVDAGEGIFCTGRRSKIVGGRIRCGGEINCLYLGAEASTSTIVMAGINPKVLQQLAELAEAKEKIFEEQEQMELDIKTLTQQKKTSRRFSEEKEKKLSELTNRNEKLNNRLGEIDAELEELKEYMMMVEEKGQVNVEKAVYPGVELYIDEVIIDHYIEDKNKSERERKRPFVVKDEYTFTKFSLEGGEIRLGEYVKPEGLGEPSRVKKSGRR